MNAETKIDNGGPAFPQPDLSGYGIGPREGKDGYYQMSGMSLRDYFAGQALGAFIQSISAKTVIEALEAGQQGEEFLADCAYDMADAMLAVRSKAGG